MIGNILFANQLLEEQFRKVATVEEEVGGWLFVGFNPLWQGRYLFDYHEFVAASLIDDPYFVNGFILAPNQMEEKRETSYRPWDWEKAGELAAASARAIGCFEVDFHTHPNGRKNPSTNDIAVAAKYSRVPDMSWFVIATTHPLRLWPYELKWNRSNSGESRVAHGKFFSWRGDKLRQFR